MVWNLKQEKLQRQRRRFTHDVAENISWFQPSQDDVNCKDAKSRGLNPVESQMASSFDT